MINKKINYINELKNKNEFKNTKIKENKENNEIAIEYQIKNEKIKLFGSSFVKNNKDKCLIKYKEKEYDLLKYFDSNLAKDRTLIIKLIGVNNITDMSCMFKGCSNLIGLPDISQFKTTKITDMSYAFSDCINLYKLPDISNWDISNVVNMSHMFDGCVSLESLPDISKWETKNVVYINSIFEKCLYISKLPDISKWNTNNVINMSSIFKNCISLIELPDLSRWETKHVIDMSSIFSNIKNNENQGLKSIFSLH